MRFLLSILLIQINIQYKISSQYQTKLFLQHFLFLISIRKVYNMLFKQYYHIFYIRNLLPFQRLYNMLIIFPFDFIISRRGYLKIQMTDNKILIDIINPHRLPQSFQHLHNAISILSLRDIS